MRGNEVHKLLPNSIKNQIEKNFLQTHFTYPGPFAGRCDLCNGLYITFSSVQCQPKISSYETFYCRAIERNSFEKTKREKTGRLGSLAVKRAEKTTFNMII